MKGARADAEDWSFDHYRVDIAMLKRPSKSENAISHLMCCLLSHYPSLSLALYILLPVPCIAKA